MKPVVDGLRKQYQGKVAFDLINTDKANQAQRSLIQQYGVTVVPTFVFVNSNGVEAKRVAGEMTAADMRKALDSLK